jgi:hypothetical protein
MLYFSLQSEGIILKERKLNIAPAIKKQVSDARLSGLVVYSQFHQDIGNIAQ